MTSVMIDEAPPEETDEYETIAVGCGKGRRYEGGWLLILNKNGGVSFWLNPREAKEFLAAGGFKP